MALLTVKVGDRKFVIDADNKGTAKAFGRKQIEVEVTDATAAEVSEFVLGGNTIQRVEAEKKEAAAEAPAAEGAAA